MRAIYERTDANTQLQRRIDSVQKKLQKDGALTQELKLAIQHTETLEELKEVLVPYETKKGTLAAQAREHGLEPIADTLWLDEASEVRHVPTCFLLTGICILLLSPESVSFLVQKKHWCRGLG